MRVKILGISFGIIILICFTGGLSCLNLQEETQEEIQNISSTWNETQGLNTSEETQKEELMLSDFPEVFKNDTIIVIGENTSQIENESAEAIAVKLENLTGNMAIIMNDTVLTENNKTRYNLILVGTPNSNSLLQEVYNLTNATRVTEEYPGENKGILEILCNPWNEEKAMLLVEGSDEWGVKAGSEILTEKEIVEELSSKMIILEFTKGKERERLEAIMEYIKRNHPDAAVFIKENMSWIRTITTVRPGFSGSTYKSDGWTVGISWSPGPKRVYSVIAKYKDIIIWKGSLRDSDIISEESYSRNE